MDRETQKARQRSELQRVERLTESANSKLHHRAQNLIDRVQKQDEKIKALIAYIEKVEQDQIEQIEMVYKHMKALEGRIGNIDQNTLTKRTILEYMRVHNMLNE